MDRYLFDTNIISTWMKLEAGLQNESTKKLTDRLRSVETNDRLLTSIVVLGELQYGIQINKDKVIQKNLEKASKLINEIQILDVNESIAKKYGELRGRLFEKFAPPDRKKKSNRVEEWIDPTTAKELGLQENDVWIAATAWSYNLVLVSNDKMARIFDVLGSELKVEDWLS